MTWAILLAAAALAGVAAAGVLRPFGSNGAATLERLTDPLEDERQSLLRALRDLEAERAEGSLSEDDFRSLRGETEARAVAVLHALEARDGRDEMAAGLKELRAARDPLALGGDGEAAPSNGNGSRRTGRTRMRWLPVAVLGLGGVAVAVPLLLGTVRNRSTGETITGNAPSAAASAGSGLAFFENRVEQHPQDLAARLDLAQRYLQTGDVRDAVAQYLEALQIDPRNPEAHANLGYLLYLSGNAADGLNAVNQALAVAPSDGQALYYKGVILLRGLHQPQEAAQAFRDYLDDAPFGSRRAEVERFLQEAERSG